MSTMASKITSLTIAYSTVYSGADQRKYQSSPLNYPRKWPVTRNMFPFDDVIMELSIVLLQQLDAKAAAPLVKGFWWNHVDL